VQDKVQLITYVDRLAGTIGGVTDLLEGPLRGVFGGVHLLPFFDPFDGADAGFDPRDHSVVDPRLGSWADLQRLAGSVQVCADLIVNHVRYDSPWLAGPADEKASVPAVRALTLEAVFPDGAREADLLRIYRPRPGLPFTRAVLHGRPRLVWTTFTGQQFDVDVRDPGTWRYLDEVMRRLAESGVTLLRLDAVGYAMKTPGTSCFLTDETFAFVDRLRTRAGELGLRTLAEVHAPYELQCRMAEHVDYIYDFALPPLVLHALHSGDVAPLSALLERRPDNVVSVLDTHDGIGVIDVGADPGSPETPGLLSPGQIDSLVESIHEASGGISRQATGASASNLDLYQVNCTWYDALGRDDARMCLSRLIQLMVPGLPQVYYVGLLAGGNDVERLRRTGIGREVNRHAYDRDEITGALGRPVTRATVAAIRLRNTHPAFAGTFRHACGTQSGSLLLEWTGDGHTVRLDAVPGTASFALTWSTPTGTRTVRTVAELAALGDDPLAPVPAAPAQ
jgi:sucrose phosphorylase